MYHDENGTVTSSMYVAQKIIEARSMYPDCEVEKIDLHPDGLPVTHAIYVHFVTPRWHRSIELNPAWFEADPDDCVPMNLPDKSRPPRDYYRFELGGLYSPHPDHFVNDDSQCFDPECFCHTAYWRVLEGPALRKEPRSRKVDKCGTVFA